MNEVLSRVETSYGVQLMEDLQANIWLGFMAESKALESALIETAQPAPALVGSEKLI